MRYFRVFLVAGLTGLFAFAGYFALLSFNLIGTDTGLGVKDVPPGHQEIAFLLPATSGDTWERFVAAADSLATEWQEPGRAPRKLRVDKQGAFVELTTDVPEVALWLDGHEHQRIWVRWYKLTSKSDCEQWLDQLARRVTPPLAVIGGDITARARTLAEELERRRGTWRGKAPLLLITTATADRYSLYLPHPNDDPASVPHRRLIEAYQGRSFRYSFTNSRMAEAVLDFVHSPPMTWSWWPKGGRNAAALAGATAAGRGWGFVGFPAALAYIEQEILHTPRWVDDRYSFDLADCFTQDFIRNYRRVPPAVPVTFESSIDYSAGDRLQPNPPERRAIDDFIERSAGYRDQRQILLLATSAERGRRWLAPVLRQLPTSRRRNLLVVSGDSISFNDVYRDRKTTWDVSDLPVSVVLFNHRHPADPAAGFRPQDDNEPDAACTATDGLLLHRDILESVLLAAYEGKSLTGDADVLRANLRRVRWRFERVILPPAEDRADDYLFDPSGERRPGTGEHVSWLRPTGEWAGGVLEVWRWAGDGWRKVGEDLAL